MSRCWILVALASTGCATISGLGDLQVGDDASSAPDTSSSSSSDSSIEAEAGPDGSVADAADAQSCVPLQGSCGNGSSGASWCCSGLACSQFGRCAPCGPQLSCTTTPDSCCSGTSYCGGGMGGAIDAGQCVPCLTHGADCTGNRQCCSHTCSAASTLKGTCQ